MALLHMNGGARTIPGLAPARRVAIDPVSIAEQIIPYRPRTAQAAALRGQKGVWSAMAFFIDERSRCVDRSRA